MARFSDKDIAEAIGEFVLANEPREVPAAGKNGTITVYGENANPYKPIIEKESNSEPDETIGGEDLGLELGGDE